MRGLLCAGAVIALVGGVLTPSPARACGGFFCDNIEPVVQTAERILFRVEDDGRITTFVEVQYEGPPSDFGWALPAPAGIAVEDITTAPAGIFDLLEEATAPRFVTPDGGAGAVEDVGGCGLGEFGSEFSPPDTTGVEVVGEAVVGPYEIQIITAESAQNLVNWLQINGYQIPGAAVGPMEHYVAEDMSFIGVKLKADAPAGPVDTLAFTTDAPYPMIPLILTSVAAAPEMEIVAYVSAPGRFVPGNYEDLALDFERVAWLDESHAETNYERVLKQELSSASDGQGFVTEFAGRVDGLYHVFEETPVKEIVPRATYLTRFHSFMGPEDMTADPYWIPDMAAPDVDNVHEVWRYADELEDTAGAERPAHGGDQRPIYVGLSLLLALLYKPRRTKG